MEVLWKIMAAVLLASTAWAESMSADLFYRAPRLFHMDDYNRCLYEGGTYCMGVFELWAEGPNDLYDAMKNLSDSNRYLMNHTLLHRTICLNSCDGQEHEPPARFERCVDRSMRQYGLRARTQRLHYCKSREHPGTRPVDWTDVAVAAVVAAIVLLNVAGTMYDLMRNSDKKPKRFLMAWSLRSNWNRLVSLSPGLKSGDERLDALAPIEGIRAHQNMLVVFAHTLLAMMMLYHLDDRVTDEFLTSAIQTGQRNGTIVVQTFVMVSSFLLAYLRLLQADKDKKMPTLRDAPAIILKRFLRLIPTVMFVIAVSATWLARAADGPMWTFVEQLEADCRAKWWTNLLFVNNFVNPEQRCGVQTWYLAVDMQVFLVMLVLTLLLLPRPQRAPKVLLAVYVCVVATNLALNIKWKMVDMSYLNTGDNLRNLFVDLESYNWLFAAPWTSLPAGLHGVMLAFLHYNFQKTGYNPATNKWLRVAAWSIFGMMAMMACSGALILGVQDPLALAVHATFNRVALNAVVTFALWAYFNGLSGWVPKYLSWRGFQIVARLSLATFLVHWPVNLAGLAVQTQPLEFTFYSLYTRGASDLIVSLVLALPLHLMVELPSQRLVEMLP